MRCPACKNLTGFFKSEDICEKHLMQYLCGSLKKGRKMKGTFEFLVDCCVALAMLLFMALIISLLIGCVSLGYHQRKLREARGLPEVAFSQDEDQDFLNFMHHVRPPEPN